MKETSKFNLLSFVGVIGAAVMIIGVFLNWIEIGIDFGILGSAYEYITGWELSTDNSFEFNGSKEYIFEYGYAPVVALIAGILAVITCILPVIKPLGFERILGIVSFIVCVIAVALTVLFSTQDMIDGEIVETSTGWIVTLAGGIIAMLGSLIPIGMRIVSKNA